MQLTGVEVADDRGDGLDVAPLEGMGAETVRRVGVVAIEGADVGDRQRRRLALDQRLQPPAPAEGVLARRLELAELRASR